MIGYFLCILLYSLFDAFFLTDPIYNNQEMLMLRPSRDKELHLETKIVTNLLIMR